MAKHQKHTKLVMPGSGLYASNEWGLVGTNCGLIKKVSKQLVDELGQRYKMSYMDADHKAGDDANNGSTYFLEYEDKINYHRFETKKLLNTFDFRQLFSESDIHLINGNHFKSQKQIVFIDAEKEKSLLKRLDQLTDIRAIVLKDPMEIYKFIRKKIESKNVPVFEIGQTGRLAAIIKADLIDSRSNIKALVLAGGKSLRMGQDKSQIKYHGKSQALYLFDLLKRLMDDVFISTTESAEHKWEVPVIKDTFMGLGPFGAILSAFREDPNSAWLVVACDLPFVNENTIHKILDYRDPSKYATAFHNKETNFPDPLITLWEPKAYSRMLQFLALGNSCPRKVLINSDIKLLKAEENWLKNVNNPEDLKEVFSIIRSLEVSE